MFGHKFRLHLRMAGSMVVILIFFACNTLLIKVNTDQWQDKFFDITIVSVVVMNIGTAILSGGLFGEFNQFQHVFELKLFISFLFIHKTKICFFSFEN